MKLEDLGYNEYFESNRKALGLEEPALARVIAEYREAYRVKGPNGEYLAKITGKQAFDNTQRADYPAVGDWVVITDVEKDKAIIRQILPRKTILSKKHSDRPEIQVIAANVDIAFIIEAVGQDYNLNRLERYFVLAKEGHIQPAVLLNKTDLISAAELELKIDLIKNRFKDTDVISTSTITEQGLAKLTEYIKYGQTYCFLGSSGVGKSSLINKLLGSDDIKTGEISGSTGKGKHTTTGREMYFLKNGGILIDNPGMREVGVADAGAGVEDVFAEITDLAKNCKYRDCSHTQEAGCAVLAALQAHTLDAKKYENYLKLKKETQYYEQTEREKRSKDRKFGKFVKKALQQLKKFKA